MHRHRVFFVALLTFIVILAGQVSAAGAKMIAYQGRLTNGSGTPVADGTYPAAFGIYTASLFGTLLWSEIGSVTTVGGMFVDSLGSVSSLPDSIFSKYDSLWLEVTVNGQTQSPRTRLMAVAWAMGVNSVDRAKGGTITGDVHVSGQLDFQAGSHPGQRINCATTDSVGGYFSTDFASDSSAAVVGEYHLGISSKNGAGVKGRSVPAGGYGVGGDFEGGFRGVRAAVNPNGDPSQFYIGVEAKVTGGNSSNYGVQGWGTTNGSGTGSKTATGVYGNANNSDVLGSSYGAFAVAVGPAHGYGVYGYALTTGLVNYGVYGNAAGAGQTNYGVYGTAMAGTTNNYAGYFAGNVNVTGTLTKGGGAFKIDHPLDPANKYLQHSFVESPDMMNIYNGNVALDVSGEAAVTLPDWFEALNQDFRYQLTAIGVPGPNLYIAQKVQGNQFRIAGGTAGMEVSWQVTGVRHDAWANANRIQVEVPKNPADKGLYLHPQAIGMGPEKGIDNARTKEIDATGAVEGRTSR